MQHNRATGATQTSDGDGHVPPSRKRMFSRSDRFCGGRSLGTLADFATDTLPQFEATLRSRPSCTFGHKCPKSNWASHFDFFRHSVSCVRQNPSLARTARSGTKTANNHHARPHARETHGLRHPCAFPTARMERTAMSPMMAMRNPAGHHIHCSAEADTIFMGLFRKRRQIGSQATFGAIKSENCHYHGVNTSLPGSPNSASLIRMSDSATTSEPVAANANFPRRS